MSLKKYFWIYFGIYLAISILLSVVGLFIDIGSGPAFIMPILAAITTGQYFVKDHSRIPDAGEKKRLVWGSLAISWGTSLIFAAIFVVLQGITSDLTEFRKMASDSGFIFFMLIILAVIFLMSYALTSWAYGGLLTKMAAKMNKANS